MMNTWQTISAMTLLWTVRCFSASRQWYFPCLLFVLVLCLFVCLLWLPFLFSFKHLVTQEIQRREMQSNMHSLEVKRNSISENSVSKIFTIIQLVQALSFYLFLSIFILPKGTLSQNNLFMLGEKFWFWICQHSKSNTILTKSGAIFNIFSQYVISQLAFLKSIHFQN